MKAFFSTDSDNEHYEKAIALAKAAYERHARASLANDPEKLALALANPEVSIIEMLLQNTIAYIFTTAASLEEAHFFLHSLIDCVNSVHNQIAHPHAVKPAPETPCPASTPLN